MSSHPTKNLTFVDSSVSAVSRNLLALFDAPAHQAALCHMIGITPALAFAMVRQTQITRR